MNRSGTLPPIAKSRFSNRKGCGTTRSRSSSASVATWPLRAKPDQKPRKNPVQNLLNRRQSLYHVKNLETFRLHRNPHRLLLRHHHHRRRHHPVDVPPIITYPEFLIQPSKPPLITLRSVLYALYGAAGLGASIYGASEFLVKPMLKSLASARHELAETAQKNLQKLNEKLEQNVSKIPPYPSKHAAAKSGSDAGEDSTQDADSITSDPTEVFHRDIATQTTPDLARGANRDSYFGFGPRDEDEGKNDPTKAVTGHLKRLEILTSHLREFVEDEKQGKVGDDAVRERLNELHTYLDSLTYLNNPVYNIYGGGDYARSGGSSRAGGGGGVRPGEEDAISTFKAEIRSVKGALLSARNFPSGRTAVASVGR
ncbi:hypothetical protein VTN77DRAFT_5649 [Rasamsonia byssochlamydoides]|uniref:uncharacterized protein n=1 Tax=Rasamsonia byssochlamydoides TaxID=89139 RepID=UPI0037434DA8